MISHLETSCLALWLVDLELLDLRARALPSMSQRVCLRLEWLGVRDEAAARSTAARLFSREWRLTEVLDRLCGESFLIRRGHAVLKADHSLPQGRRLIRVVDPDTLVALHPVLFPEVQDPLHWPAVPMDDGGLISGLAAKGSVDTHIHLGGALPPCFYWLLFVSGAVAPESARALVTPDRGHADADAWIAAFRCASWLRFALAAELETWTRDHGSAPVFPHLPAIDDSLWDLFHGDDDETRLATLTSLELRETLFGLTRALRADAGGSEWLLHDPLHRPPDGGSAAHYAEGERRLLAHVRRMLDASSREPDRLKRLERRLLAYLRARNAFHGLLVHDQGSEGLFRFSESLRRRGLGYREPRRRSLRKRRLQRSLLRMEEVRMQAALEAQLVEPFGRGDPASQERPLRRIEMRVSVPFGPLSFRQWRAWIDGIAAHLRPEEETAGARSQVGLVFHLHKGKEDDKAAQRAVQEALRLYHFLEGHPGLRSLTVGLDVAGSERAAPPRTFLPAFRRLQELVDRHRPRLQHHPPMRIGYTYHVGEDCTDLLTGLRHIDEVTSLLLPEEDGGRLGHALALAEDPQRFYGRRGLQTEPTTATHLLDLVWAWGRLLDSERAAACSGLQRKILLLMGNALLDTAAIARCWEAMWLDGPRIATEGETSERDLLGILGFRGSPPLTTVQADKPWMELLTSLQVILQERIKKRRICIEANPTSNLIIGGYNDYDELPCLAMVEAGLPVSINTDDPGMFMTSLPGEATALYGALEKMRLPHRAALVWLADRWFDAEHSTFLGTPRRWTSKDFETLLRSE